MDKSPLQSSRRPYSPRYKRERMDLLVFFLPLVVRLWYRVYILNYGGRSFSQPQKLAPILPRLRRYAAISDICNRHAGRAGKQRKKNGRNDVHHFARYAMRLIDSAIRVHILQSRDFRHRSKLPRVDNC